MPKVLELTLELDLQRVSCPGVWLCQDGRVSLTVFALGTSYQTCMMPPIFPIMFKDVFYFRKRFQGTCALNNICCLLKDETIYCELVQWCEDCSDSDCVILAQYLGALNDVLFPSNMCSSDGVDLLMRRSKDFPGILSPKIEIATKVRIDELYSNPSKELPASVKIKACSCKKPNTEGKRQMQVCHTPMYHRIRCTNRSPTRSRSRSRCHSVQSKSSCSLTSECTYANRPKSRLSFCPYTESPKSCKEQQSAVYRTEVPTAANTWHRIANNANDSDNECELRSRSYSDESPNHRKPSNKKNVLLESKFIDYDSGVDLKAVQKKHAKTLGVKPCICEICKRYHELFHDTNVFRS